MNCFVAERDVSVRQMIRSVIEERDFGRVVGETDDARLLTAGLLTATGTDVLLLDWSMTGPRRPEMIGRLRGDAYVGTIVLLAEPGSKEDLYAVYAYGIESCLTKPIHPPEIAWTLSHIREKLELRRTIEAIREKLNAVLAPARPTACDVKTCAEYLLREIGIAGECGYTDLVQLACIWYESPHRESGETPLLKQLYEIHVRRKLGAAAREQDVRREIKACEQRVRRAIGQALIQMASLGLTDYAHPVFEKYAYKYFDFHEVRRIMNALEENEKPDPGKTSVNVKKFLQPFFLDLRAMAENPARELVRTF